MHPIDAVQTARLTSDLQAIAQAAEHAQPLLLGVEQQGGLVGHSFRFAMQDTIDRTTLLSIRWCNQFACCDQNQWTKALQRRFDQFQPATSDSVTNHTFTHTPAAIKDSQECEYLAANDRTGGCSVDTTNDSDLRIVGIPARNTIWRQQE